jgi:outer membrane protein assembly factor BamB
MMRCRCLSLVALLAMSRFAEAEDWPGWRGPRGDGTSLETSVPTKWSQTENVAWKTPIPGVGHSSPIVVGDRVFVTTCLVKERQRVLLCLDRQDGKILWQKVVITAPLEGKHGLNSFASSTPAGDSKHVWVTFFDKPHIVVVCYDHDGRESWRTSPGTFTSMHGFCSSLLLYKDSIILNADQDAPKDGEAFLVALDKNTGTERWRTDRPNRIRSHCAPLITKAAGKMQMVLSGCNCVASYDPDTGKQIWIIDGPTEQYVASPVFGDGVFFLTCGFPDFHNMAILPDGTGNVTATHVLWHENRVIPKKAAYVPSPIAHGKYFFVVSDLGYLNCFEARTGKRLYDIQQLGKHHSASPVSANGLLYFTSDEGVTFVLKAGPVFELVARNDLGEDCRASPAISRGQILLRTLENLYSIGKPDGR